MEMEMGDKAVALVRVSVNDGAASSTGRVIAQHDVCHPLPHPCYRLPPSQRLRQGTITALQYHYSIATC
jgi:hypothetical protein